MKKFMFLLIAMLMSIGTSTFAGTKTASSNSEKFTIPVNLIVKQTVTFTDGKTIELFYQKDGGVCRLYSCTDVTKYSKSDLNRVKATSFEITNHIEGKCLMTKKTGDVMKFARSVLKQLG